MIAIIILLWAADLPSGSEVPTALGLEAVTWGKVVAAALAVFITPLISPKRNA